MNDLGCWGRGVWSCHPEEAAWRKGIRILINSQELWVVSRGLVLEQKSDS